MTLRVYVVRQIKVLETADEGMLGQGAGATRLSEAC
jgi:hypothetical protein